MQSTYQSVSDVYEYFEVCGGPWATSGKLAASVAIILSQDNQL